MLGKCNQCECEIYEVLRSFPDGSPKQVGKPLPNCKEVHVILMNGNTMKITVCDQCELDFKHLSKHALEGWKEELSDNYRIKVGAKSLNAKQMKTALTELFNQIDNPILGLYT